MIKFREIFANADRFFSGDRMENEISLILYMVWADSDVTFIKIQIKKDYAGELKLEN